VGASLMLPERATCGSCD